MLLLSRKKSPQKFFNKTPEIAVVIGTYGSTAYVELQLESIRKFCPSNLPILIHDDGSTRYKEFSILAGRYKTSLHCASKKISDKNSHNLGDLSAFIQGLMWAKSIKADILVKFSRRWITLKPWVELLQHMAFKTQFPTYSSYCVTHRFGFRTEAMAMAVEPWFNSHFLDNAFSRINSGNPDNLAEVYMHDWAQKVMENNCEHNKRLLSFLPVDLPFGGCMRGYGMWSSMLGESRTIRRDRQLWHETHSPEEYALEARKLGLRLTKSDFAVLD